MQQAEVTLTNEVGLHARPASLFVRTASGFTSRISVSNGQKTVNAKSIVSVMSLGARKGTSLTIEAEGSDEAEAVRALIQLVADNFGEQ